MQFFIEKTHSAPPIEVKKRKTSLKLLPETFAKKQKYRIEFKSSNDHSRRKYDLVNLGKKSIVVRWSGQRKSWTDIADTGKGSGDGSHSIEPSAKQVKCQKHIGYDKEKNKTGRR